MPRGVKKTPETVENQIAELDAKIESHQSKIAALNAKKKTLLESREKAEIEALYQFIKQSGKTPAEFLSQLSGQ